MIDSVIPEILTFKECSMRVSSTSLTSVGHAMNTLDDNISGRKRSIKFSFLFKILSYLGASDRPIKKLANSPFKQSFLIVG